MNDTGVILNYYKELSAPESEKTKIIRSFFSYALDRKPSNAEYAMLFKLVKDFDYNIVFEALVSARYSSVDFNSNYWGYVVTVCKSLMKELIKDEVEPIGIEGTKKLLNGIKSKIKDGR